MNKAAAGWESGRGGRRPEAAVGAAKETLRPESGGVDGPRRRESFAVGTPGAYVGEASLCGREESARDAAGPDQACTE